MPSTAVELAGRRVVVTGIATSGRAVADVLLDRGARVVVVDGRDGPAEREAAAALRARGAEVRLADAETPVDCELVVTSPGWRPDQPLLAAAAAAGVEVVGEPELAWRLRPDGPDGPAPWVAVTGTNGKTTTTGMVESVLRHAGLRTVAAGNVGLPLLSAVLERPAYDVIAVELSSFQLHWSRELAPEVGAVLNIAEDHLDWHGSMAAYVEAKAAVWRAGTVGVFNADDPVVAALAAQRLTRPRPFSTGPASGPGYGVAGAAIVEDATPILPVGALSVSGPHNVANAVAAAALTRVFGESRGGAVSLDAVAAGLAGYRPGAHRNTVVGVAGGVTFVDDSKATNPHAAAASLAAYPAVVWVAGGLLKGADVAPLVAEHRHRLRGVVVIGADRSALLDAIARHAPDVPVVEVDARDTEDVGSVVMERAVDAAASLATTGDTVLLAPAAASMDQFRDYAERGDRFAAAVRRRLEEAR